MTKQAERSATLRAAAIGLYLETGEAPDVATLAERIDRSASTVRRWIDEARGGVDGCVYVEDWRDSESRDYPGMTAGVHRVGTYQPTPETLRALLLKAREALHVAIDRADGVAEAHDWNADHEACDAEAEVELANSARRDADRYHEALSLDEVKS